MEAANQVDPKAMDAAQSNLEKKRFPQRYPEDPDLEETSFDPSTMDPVQRDLVRQRIVKKSLIAAEEKFSKHPGDAESLTQWARALLYLSQFGDAINDSNKMLEDAISKLHAALTINPTMHEAMWCLGEVHSCKAFRTHHDEAKSEFDQAFKYFKNAVELGMKAIAIP